MAGCENALEDNTFFVLASGQASINSNADQDIEQGNRCEDLDTLCQNNGENALLINTGGTSKVNSVSDETIDTNNDCRAGAQYTTDPENSFSIVAQDRDVRSTEGWKGFIP